jgi:hypothetical protein
MGSLRNQQYAGRSEEEGVKKPLNAFLGELFLGKWEDEELGETRLVSEQVSHHPPITACYIWNDKYGIRAEGFTEQEITFTGNVNIKQKGYAILHIDKYDEDYLMPVPNVKVKGILSGRPYPELQGSYSLVSSTGYVSHIKFEGKSFFGGGQKNAFEARLFHVDRPEEILYTAKGVWNGESSFEDARSGKQIEKLDFMTLKSIPLQVADTAEQDPWESRRAWGDTIAALRRGDMKGAADSKAIIERGQRQMRKEEAANETSWKSLFFQPVDHDPIFDTLSVHGKGSFTVDRAAGIWKVNKDAVQNAKKPYHGDLLPTNERMGASGGEYNGTSGGQKRSQSEATTVVSPDGVSPHKVTGEEALTQHTTDPLPGSNSPIVSRAEEAQTVRVAETSKGPTEAQVEHFLRNKFSASPI